MTLQGLSDAFLVSSLLVLRLQARSTTTASLGKFTVAVCFFEGLCAVLSTAHPGARGIKVMVSYLQKNAADLKEAPLSGVVRMLENEPEVYQVALAISLLVPIVTISFVSLIQTLTTRVFGKSKELVKLDDDIQNQLAKLESLAREKEKEGKSKHSTKGLKNRKPSSKQSEAKEISGTKPSSSVIDPKSNVKPQKAGVYSSVILVAIACAAILVTAWGASNLPRAIFPSSLHQIPEVLHRLMPIRHGLPSVLSTLALLNDWKLSPRVAQAGGRNRGDFWSGLPLLLRALSLSFLALSMLESRGSNSVVDMFLKSSPLAQMHLALVVLEALAFSFVLVPTFAFYNVPISLGFCAVPALYALATNTLGDEYVTRRVSDLVILEFGLLMVSDGVSFLAVATLLLQASTLM